MSWQKIAEDAYRAHLTDCKFFPSFEELPVEYRNLWELAARQAVWSWQMGMLKKDPELMVVLTPEMKQG